MAVLFVARLELDSLSFLCNNRQIIPIKEYGSIGAQHT